MKKLVLLILVMAFSHQLVSQTTCTSSAAFCAGQSATTFPAGVNNGSAAAGPDYGCLGSEPNPAWYYFQVSQSGSINIAINGTGGGDVDFICWGPFTSQATACGNLTAGNTIDCSYSSSPTETCTITNASAGQFYMLLITNYSNQTQNINFNQTSGTGSTNCGLLTSGVTSQTICPGAMATLLANSSIASPSYVWTPGGATTSSIVVSPSVTTVYSVTISGLNPATSTPTVITNSGTVTVNSVPTITVSTNSPVCQGSPITLTASPGLTSYTWTGSPSLNQVTTINSLTIPNSTGSMTGTYSVVAKTAQGCTATATASVTVIQTGTVTVVPTTTVCENETVFLTASSVPAATAYTWLGPNSYSSSVQNPVINNAIPSQSGTYTVIASFIMGATACPRTSVSLVSVVALPVVTLGSNGIVCQGSDIKLNSTPGLAGYTWTGPAALSQTTTADSLILPNADPGMQGNYTVLAQTVEGCTATASASVEVIQTGSVTVTPSFTACQGSMINLTASSIPTADSYDWTGPSYMASTANPVLNNLLPSQSGIYVVTASFTSGTVSCTMINSSSVYVIPAPPVNLSPMATVCNNGNINLNAPNGGTSYLWGGPNSFTSTDQNPVIANATVINEGTYSLTVTSSGCVNRGSVDVNVFPVLSFLSVPTDIILCAGKTGILNSNGGSGGSGTYSYVWSPTTGLSSPAASATGVTGVATTDYTLTLADASCPMTLAQATVVKVTVNPTPVITFSTSNNRGCEPFCTDLISNSVPASVNSLWQFSNSTGLNSGGTPNFCFPVHGTYDASLTVTDVNGCVDSIRQSAFIVVDPKPEPSFDYLPANPTVLINEVSFTDLSTVGAPMQDWHWNFGDYNATQQSDTANVQNTSHIYDYAGTYTVNLEVTNSFGCTDNVSRIVVVEEEFALFIPNAFTPTKPEGKNDVFKVQGMGFIPDGFEMTIYDRWGTVVFKTNDVTKGWDGSIKGGPLGKEGVYVYKILVLDTKNREKEFLGYISLL